MSRRRVCCLSRLEGGCRTLQQSALGKKGATRREERRIDAKAD